MASTLPVNGSFGKTSLPWPLPEVWKGKVDKGYFCDDGKETLAARRPAPATADAGRRPSCGLGAAVRSVCDLGDLVYDHIC